ncbi:HEAT repeat domain-containing protein [filamentous cyanobacterium LEGE 11480]|uniref:HEAT repeat domain-containing protein n=1 Tax=Romeriopsis navalis LEGE 11480 TaxID=2777977 RepID=A0A928VM77_9CYAN|nr:HEAT repeat domain-containing protein [Romeriopsis navalis]MBE9029231.1 HEAT repeat domain-containing protein [Romeriopsis navalis LEGE 11480]
MKIELLLGALAAILGIFGVVLFGRPKGETQDAAPTVEQVEVPPVPPTDTADKLPTFEPNVPPSTPTSEAVGSAMTDAAGTDVEPSPTVPETAPIADPWAEDSATAIIDPDAENDSEVATPADRAEAMAASQSALPPASAPSMPPFAAIHDPKRPSTPMLQDLSQEIVSMGTSQKLSYVPKLAQYSQHDDPMMRCYVAHAMGHIAAANSDNLENQPVIPALGNLMDDADPSVRQMALKALSRIQAPQVLPYLEKGALTASGSVKELADAAIQKLRQ